MTMHDTASLREALPYARRYARALSGSQGAGDALVAESLRRGLPALPARLALYYSITLLSELPGIRADEPLSPRERCALLLTSLEGLTTTEAAQVLAMEEADAETTIAEAREKVKQTVSTDVLIIEDEPVIALDIRLLVTRCGHKVVGVAASETEAIRLAREQRPGLILADVNLGRGGDGITAVRRILESVEIPVIFVTAYPERLLTAEGVEPAFIINKPFDRMTLAIATYQAISAGRIPIQ
jgi:CheY-like chemotaxis protein